MLGNSAPDSPEIIVTLNRSMLEKPKNFSDLIESGMTIARINSAHDDLSVWVKLVETLKNEEQKLNENAGKTMSHCKVYIGLAGPKIRIAPFMQEEIHSKLKRMEQLAILYVVSFKVRCCLDRSCSLRITRELWLLLVSVESNIPPIGLLQGGL